MSVKSQMATYPQGRRQVEPNDGEIESNSRREYENNVTLPATGITDDASERTPLISRPNTIIEEDFGKSTVQQTVFNSVV